MNKQLKQSTICTIMAISSCCMALFILFSGLCTALLFSKVTTLNGVQASMGTDIRKLITVVAYQKDMVRSYTQEGNPVFFEMYQEEVTQSHAIDTLLASIKALTNDPKGQTQLQAIVQTVEGMRTAEQTMISLVQSKQIAVAQTMAFGKDYGLLIDGLNQAVSEFEEGMRRGMGSIIERQSHNVMLLGIFVEILCVLLILIQITNALITKKLIIKPLIKIKTAMTELCAGHLSVQIDVPVDHSEMGQLAGAMLDMQEKISAYIKEIDFVLHRISQKDMSIQVENQYVGDFEPIHNSLTMIIGSLSDTFSMLGRSIDQISGGAEHVSNAAQALAQGAAEQANSVEQLSFAVNQVSQQITSNAANAVEANSFVVSAGASLHTSTQQMSMMINAMTEISASSSEISKIIKTIEDIAFQTNILALNAAVEAARAGVAGKGFAVVADEVRNLATKSSEAAKQTNALIETSVNSVQNGVQIANETALSLADVVSGSLAMADLIVKISQGGEEQSVSIVQINQSVEQISSVVQTNSATSEQSAAESQELSSQANIMKDMVNAYTLHGQARSAPHSPIGPR